MKNLFRSYKELIGILLKENPSMVCVTLFVAILLGLSTPFSIFVNSHIFNDGLLIAAGTKNMSDLTPYLICFVILSVVPSLLQMIYLDNYVEKRTLLILRTSYKGKMLKKLKSLKYEHLENKEDMEIIDKAYHRAENSSRILFPMITTRSLAAFVASIGTMVYLTQIRWWLLVTVLVPFLLEAWLVSKKNMNIYEELETYWEKERRYSTLAGYLRSRDYSKELKLFGNASYLIKIYKDRLHKRNKEYENYVFKNLKHNLSVHYITKVGSFLNVFLVLLLFINNQLSIGIFIAVSLQLLNSVYNDFMKVVGFFLFSGMHINTFHYYTKYFELSDEPIGTEEKLPEKFDIEFRDVWFRYPGSENDILKGVSFFIHEGEKVSIIGKNGEGKSTIVKLLLGLFTPDRGEILIGGKPLLNYTSEIRSNLYGSVLQDFVRFSIPLRENIGVGNIEKINDTKQIEEAANKAKVDQFIHKLKDGYDTLLGRDFENGVDLSGGQWQRIAIARAFMGDKKILLLDEPTSQLDPMAESKLYMEFAKMAEKKTALLITHRLGATKITDTILILDNGCIAEQGSHETLMNQKGIYATMFESQKQWYDKKEEGEKDYEA